MCGIALVGSIGNHEQVHLTFFFTRNWEHGDTLSEKLEEVEV